MKTAVLIYNPVAGRHPLRREREVREAASVLRKDGMEVRLEPTTGPGMAQSLARTAVGRGTELVLVCGGDGTVNEVMNGVALSGATLGVLPGGTANIIAKELRLPHHPVRAARALPQWKPRSVALGQAVWHGRTKTSGDPGEPQQRFFAGVAGIGFDAYVVHKLAWDFKMSWGVMAYAIEAVRQATRYPFPSFACQTEGGVRRATFAVIHRAGHYAGWLPLAPTARLFKPNFSACFFKSESRARYYLYAAAVVLRQHLRLRDVELIEGCKFVCSPEKPGQPIFFELDGELAGEIPATFEIVPDALTLLVP